MYIRAFDSIPGWFSLRPTVGQMLDLCEENYRLLHRLIPRLQDLPTGFNAVSSKDMDLHLEVLEQTPYTSLIHLTYYFPHQEESADPDAVLRLYHDACQIDVVRLRQTALPLQNIYQHPGLLNRWKVNVFLSKWLNYCIQQGHAFILD